MEPGNPLEHALVAAAAEASARPLFYRLLLESPLLLLDAGTAPPVADEQSVLHAGTRVKAVCVEVAGIPHTAIFSSLAVLQASVRTEHKYISMIGRDLLNLVRGSHLMLNPGASYGKQILPDEIDAILSGQAAQGYATLTMQKETRVLLGQPAEFPTYLIAALSALFRSAPHVRKAYLGLCSWPESGEQHLMVGVDTTGNWQDLMRQISSALRGSTRPDQIVDFVKMDDSSLASYLRGTRPFYRKKFFGLF